ncbi:unnamed protein product, partial [Nesidiocoris tenuis]
MGSSCCTAGIGVHYVAYYGCRHVHHRRNNDRIYVCRIQHQRAGPSAELRRPFDGPHQRHRQRHVDRRPGICRVRRETS